MFGILRYLLEKDKQDYEYAIKSLRDKDSSVFDYDFIMSLEEKKYPKFLCIAYQIKTGFKLNLKHPKTLNEKIQWLKIYDNIPLKTMLTDKVLVRDWIKEKIGEEYLKPVLQICNSFDEIVFDKLPERFIIKCNHGCKWQIIIKEKNKFIGNKQIYNYVKKQFDGWMEQSFFGWSDFETQYKNIVPKIIIETLLRDEKFSKTRKEVRNCCFNGIPYYNQLTSYIPEQYQDVFDINLNKVNTIFEPRRYPPSEKEADELVEKSVELSKILAKNLKFVRVDWMLYDNKLYFEEMTFTPFSGFINIDNYLQIKLGSLLNLKGNKNEQ